MAGERPLQVQPGLAARLVEGMAAGLLGQQQGLRAHQRGQRTAPLRQRGQGVEVDDASVLAVQIQHEVGVQRQAEQGALQVFGRGADLGGGVRAQQGGADQGGVGSRVAAQPGRHRGGHGRRQVGIGPVEVHAVRQAEPPVQPTHHALLQADRVRHRDNDDLAPDAPGVRMGLQQPDQVPRRQHPRHLVRVETGLDVNLGSRPGRPEPVDGQRVRRPRRQAGERQGLHHAAARRSSVRGCSGERLAGGSAIGPGVWPIGSNRARRRASASLALTGKVS